MEGILKDIQVLACGRLMGTATEAQVKEIEEAIKQMDEMPPSLQDETGSVNQTSYGSGHNILTSGGNTNINSGRGEFYHNIISGGATFGINVPNSTVNIITEHQSQQHLPDPQTQNCLRDLRTTDPRDDKTRIEETKGGLLEDSYRWILEHSDFQ